MLVPPSLPLPKEKVGGRICVASLRVLGHVVSIRGIQLFYSSGDFGGEILRQGQMIQAENEPFALEQVNTCVGNVLPLPGSLAGRERGIFGGKLLHLDLPILWHIGSASHSPVSPLLL